MPRFRVRGRAPALFALTLLLASSALAWVQIRSTGGSKPLLIRVGGSLDFGYEQDGIPTAAGSPAGHAALNAARATLNGVLTSDANAGSAATFNLAEPTACSDPNGINAGDGENRVFAFSSDDCGAGGVLALTVVHHNTSTGEITGCDIAFNADDHNWNGTSPDLEGVALGEFLECFGIARSPVAGNFNTSGHEVHGAFSGDFSQQATQYPFHSNTTAERSLHSDDIAALSTLYPNAQTALDFGSITGTVTASGGSGVKGAHVVAVSTAAPDVPVVGYLAHIDDMSAGTPGFFRLTGLAPGDYFIRVEPLTGFPNSFSASDIGESGFNTTFPPEFWSDTDEDAADAMPGSGDAAATSVTAGATATGRNIVINTIGGVANDTFATRTTLTDPFTEAINTAGATNDSEPLIPSTCIGSVDTPKKGVWYTFTAPLDGDLTFSTEGSNYDTVAEAVRGSPGSFTFVACNDDVASTNLQSKISLVDPDQGGVAQGDTIHFVVGDLTFDPMGGTLVVNFDFVKFNHAPVADNDGPFMTDEDTPLPVAAPGVLDGDTDEDGDPLMVDTGSVMQPAVGSVVVMADGSFTFTPNHDFLAVGEMQNETFTYKATDGGKLSNTATVTVQVTGLNDAPTADAQAVATNEDTALPITLTGSDVDTTDILAFMVVSGPTNGVLSGAAPNLTYTPNADFNGMDSFDFTVDDGNGGADMATVTITVNPVNDPPSFTGGGDDTVAEDSGPRTVAGWATGMAPGPVTATDEAAQNLTFMVTGNTNPGLFSAGPAVALSGDLTYTPAPDANGTADITVVLMDDGGTANGGNDTSAPHMFTLTVTAVNDAPVLDNSATMALTAILEDTAAPAGDTVAAILATGAGGNPITDVDSGALEGIAVTGVDNTNGTWEFSTDGGAGWTAFGSPSVAAARLLSDAVTNRIRFVPNADFNGAAAISFRAWDQTSGADGGVADVSVNGGTTAFSAAAGGAQITVTAVNDAPSFADMGNVTVDEDTGPFTTPAWATAISAGPVDEAAQNLTFVVTGNTNPALFSAGPAMDSATGNLTFSTPADAFGSADITVVLMDDGGTANGGDDTSSPHVLTITVNAVNDDPVATDDMASGNEDTTLGPITVLANDTDVENDPLTVMSVTQGTNGSVAISMDMLTVSYTPDADFNGPDSFTYTVSDGNGGTDTATVNVTVTAVNDPPSFTHMGDVNRTEDDGAVTVPAWASDLSPGPANESAQTLQFNITGNTNPALFAVPPAVSALTGDLAFTLAANANGSATITVTLMDDGGTANGGSDTSVPAMFNINVAAVNDPPVAADDMVSGDEDTSIGPITVLANDFDVENDSLTITMVTQGTNGSVVINGGTTVTYTPVANFNGMDSFTYTVSDGNGGTDIATVNVTVNPVNDAPVANDDPLADLPETAGPTVLDVLANDTDVDLDTLSISAVGAPACGLVVNNGADLTYTPNNVTADCAESFTYTASDGAGGFDSATVSFTVLFVNQPPVAADDSGTVNEDSGATVFDVLANDTEPDGQALTIVAVTQPGSGLVVNNSADVTYTPAADFNGMESFTYTIEDASGAQDTATVNVAVTAVNDPPTFTGGPNPMAAEDSGPQSLPGWATSISAGPANEAGQTVNFQVTNNTNPALFSAQPAVSPTGTLTFTPAPNAFGMAGITVVLMDNGGTANGGSDTGAPFVFTITVTPVNDDPVAADDMFSSQKNTQFDQAAPGVLANDTDVENNPLVVTTTSSMPTANGGTVQVNANGSFTYVPALDFGGNDTFTYSISDGQGGVDSATVTIFVTPNAPPSAVDDMAATNEDTFVDVNVLANDTDTDGPDPLLVAGFTQGANGAVSDLGGGVLRYSPNLNFNGMDSFTYNLTDGIHIRTGTVAVTVTAVNDAPSFTGGPDDAVAEDDVPRVVSGWASNISAGPPDEQGAQTLMFAVTSNTNPALFSAAPAVDASSGDLTYTTALNAFGSADITIALMDNGGTANGGADTSAPFTFTITVFGVNDTPVAGDDMFTVNQGSVNNDFDVLANDTDVDDVALSLNNVSDPPNGAAAATNGTIAYTPDFGFNGMDTFTYQACDPSNACDTATVTVTVLPNLPPTAADDSPSTLEDTLVDIGVLANDTDPENDPLSVSGFTQGANGAVSNQGGGVLRYTPNADFNGMDSFTYTIDDGMGNSDTGTVNVTVTAVNDAPSFTGGPDQTVAEDSGAQSVPGWATSLSRGPADEAGQTLSFSVTGNTNSALFSAPPAVSPTGTLTFTPALNATGSADITVALMDNGGTANGGADTSAPYTFTITVTPVNDPPDILALGSNPSGTTPANSPAGRSVMFTVVFGDPDGDTHTFDWSGDCGMASVQNPTLTCPVGVNTVNVTVDDNNGGSDSASIDITVTDYMLAAACQGGNPPCNSATMATVTAGQGVNFNLTATGINGTYNAPITFSCQGLPSLTTCTFTPSNTLANAPPGGSTIAVRIQTTAPIFAQLEAPNDPRGSAPPLYALWMGVPGLALFGVVLAGGRGQRRRLGRLCLLAVVLVMGAALAGCGGGGSDVVPRSRPGTPRGTYSITVRAAGTGTLDHTVNLTVVVQ